MVGSLEFRIWNFESGIWNLEFGIWNLECGDWNVESEIVEHSRDRMLSV